MVLPAQHEIHQERNERGCQQSLRDRTEAASQKVCPIGAWNGIQRFRSARPDPGFPDSRRAAEPEKFPAESSACIWTNRAKNDGLIGRVVHQARHQSEQQNDGDGSGQTARQVKADKQFHHRRQNERQQHRHQHHRQHQFAPIAKTQNGRDSDGGERPMRLMRLGRRDAEGLLLGARYLCLVDGHSGMSA